MSRKFLIPVILTVVCSAALGAEVPREAPDIMVQLADGDSVSPGQYRGKVVVLEFLKTTCSICRHTAGIVEKLSAEYGEDLQVIGAAVDDDAANLVEDYARKQGLTFPVGYVPILEAYRYLEISVMKLMHLPQLVIIDKKGMIRAQHAGPDPFFRSNEEENLREILGKLLAE